MANNLGNRSHLCPSFSFHIYNCDSSPTPTLASKLNVCRSSARGDWRARILVGAASTSIIGRRGQPRQGACIFNVFPANRNTGSAQQN